MSNFAPRCQWVSDRCQHGRNIDDPTTRWNPNTRRHTCDAIYVTREERRVA